MLSQLERMSLQDSNLDIPDSTHEHLDESSSRTNSLLLEEEKNTFSCDAYLPERIIFVVDTVSSPKSSFVRPTDQSVKTLIVVKMAIETFVRNKSAINREHEFGIITLENSKIYNQCPLTNDINHFLSRLRNIQEDSCSENQTFNFDYIFGEIGKLNIFSEATKKVTRIVLLYSRYLCLPNIAVSLKENYSPYKALMRDELFFLDLVLIYGEVNEDEEMERLENVFQALVGILKKNSYAFTVTRCIKTLFEHMAKLLAHPLQRGPQNSSEYTINELLLKV